MAPNPVILVLGPTAAGKTDLAVALAQRLPGGGECVCADSMQVYRGMDIGTAKPTARQREAVPHHLLDLADPRSDGFTVDAWLELASRAVEAIRARGRWAVLVGGTNLYVQAFLEGLFDGPAPDPALRDELTALDTPALRRRLEACDPAAARRIHANDRRRAVRAVEVYEQTGRRLSDLQRQWFDGEPRRDVRLIGLAYGVEAINRRINRRVKAMIAGGLVEEVRRLQADGPLGRQASQALGYRQVLEHLAGRLSLEEAVQQIAIRTRRFARQQRSWLRRFRTHPHAIWIPAEELSPQALVEAALRAILRPEQRPAGSRGGLRGPEGVSERLS